MYDRPRPDLSVKPLVGLWLWKLESGDQISRSIPGVGFTQIKRIKDVDHKIIHRLKRKSFPSLERFSSEREIWTNRPPAADMNLGRKPDRGVHFFSRQSLLFQIWVFFHEVMHQLIVPKNSTCYDRPRPESERKTLVELLNYEIDLVIRSAVIPV